MKSVAWASIERADERRQSLTLGIDAIESVKQDYIDLTPLSLWLLWALDPFPLRLIRITIVSRIKGSMQHFDALVERRVPILYQQPVKFLYHRNMHV